MPRNNSSRHSQFPNSQILGITIEEFNQQRLNYDPDPKRSEKLVKATKDFYSSHNLGYDHYAKAYQEVLALCLYPHEVRQAISRLEDPHDYELEVLAYHKMIETSSNIGQLSDFYDQILSLDDSGLSMEYRKKWNVFFTKETPIFRSPFAIEKYVGNPLCNKYVCSQLFHRWYELQMSSLSLGIDLVKQDNPFFKDLIYHDEVQSLYQELLLQSDFKCAYNTFATHKTNIRKEESRIFILLDRLLFKEIEKLQNQNDFDLYISHDIVQSYMHIRPGIRLRLKEIAADFHVKELIKSQDYTLLTNSLFLTDFKRRFLIQQRIKELTNH